MNHTNSGNIVSLFQTKTMALYKFNDKPFKIGKFHLGNCQSKWHVWSDKFFKELEAKDFDSAVTEAYTKIVEYCNSLKIPPPPKPA